MDRLRGSGPQHPRDPAASEPSQDSGKWQEYDEEKGGPALRTAFRLARPSAGCRLSGPPLPCPSARSIALHHEASRDPHRDASNFGVVTST